MTDLASLRIATDTALVENAIRRLRDLDAAARATESAQNAAALAGARRWARQEAALQRLRLVTEQNVRAQAALRRETELGARAVDRFQRNISNLVRAATFIGAGFLGVNVLRNTVGTIAEYERALVGVAKTTNSTAAETAVLDERFRAMALSAKAPLVELLQYGRIAGQLGIRGTENITKFSATMSKLALATQDIRGEEGALQLSKLINLTQTAPKDVGRLADSLVQLGNTIGATEGSILRTATFVGASLAPFRTSSKDVLGFAGAVAALGQRAETSATTFYKSFSLISQAVAGGGKQLELFASVAGMSSEEFSKTFQQSSTDAFVSFLLGLDRTVKGGAQLQQVLKALGFEASDSARVLAALSSNVGLVQQSLFQSAKGYNENKAATDEADRAMNTLQGSLDKLSNTYKLFLVNLGDRGLNGALRGTVDVLREVFILFGGLQSATTGVSTTARIAAIAVASLGAAFAGLLIGRFVALLIAAANAFGLLNKAAVAFNITMRVNPVTAVVTTLSALIGVAIGASAALDDMSDSAKRLQAATQDLQDTASRIKEIQNALDFARVTKNSSKEIEALTRQMAELEQIGAKSRDRDFIRTVIGDPKLLDELSKQFAALGVQADFANSPAIGKIAAQFEQLRQVQAARPGAYTTRAVNEWKASIEAVEKQIEESIGKGGDTVTAFVQQRLQQIRERLSQINDQMQKTDIATSFDKARDAVDGFLTSLKEETRIMEENVKNGELASKILAARLKAEEKLGDTVLPDKEAYLRLVEDEIIKQEELNALIEQRADIRKELEREREAYDEASKGLEEYVDNIFQQLELLKMTADQREIETEIIEYQKIAREGLVEVSEAELGFLRLLLTAQQAARKEAEARDRLDNKRKNDPRTELIENLERELQLLGMTVSERETSLALAQLEDQLRTRGVVDAKARAEELRSNIELLQQRLTVVSAMREVGEAIGNSVAQGVKTAIREGGKLRDFFANLFDSIWQAAFDAFISRIIADQIGSLMARLGLNLVGAAAGSATTGGGGSSPGAASSGVSMSFARGGIYRYARGGIDRGLAASIGAGVVTSPTLAPMALVGEGTRAEAIMPLEKNLRGEQSVMASINGRSALLPVGRLADGNMGITIGGDRSQRFAMGGIVEGRAAGGRMPRDSATAARLGQEPTASVQAGRGGITIQQTIQTPNPDAFRSSQAQTIAQAKRAARMR